MKLAKFILLVTLLVLTFFVPLSESMSLRDVFKGLKKIFSKNKKMEENNDTRIKMDLKKANLNPLVTFKNQLYQLVFVGLLQILCIGLL